MKKISLMLLSLLMVSACSNGFQKIEVDSTNSSEVRVATNKELNVLQNRGTLKASDKLYVANLGVKNGGQFLTKINFNSFKTKASVDGVLAKTSDDVHSVDVYLLKLSSNYNPSVNKDPITLSKMTTDPVWMRNMLKNGSEINLLFTGVPGLASKQYYVGVVAKDVDGNVISKNGYAWTGDTSSVEGFNLSSTGVGVNPTSLEVSETDALSIAVSLKDAVGAKLDTTVNVNDGSSNLPNVDGATYQPSMG